MEIEKNYHDLEAEIEKLKKELVEKDNFYIERLNEKKKILENVEKNEKLLHDVVEAAAGKIGQDFFDNIVIKLSEWLGAECVLIG
jgi:predicted nuclease of restriction endonuclease-like (RecB) superfamily